MVVSEYKHACYWNEKEPAMTEAAGKRITIPTRLIPHIEASLTRRFAMDFREAVIWMIQKQLQDEMRSDSNMKMDEMLRILRSGK